ncbi:MAG: fused MFS/spermidine synthase [Bacteroidales bacterium]|nr:fused MFS/spermidine synthase [Bacteroidales bacterium]
MKILIEKIPGLKISIITVGITTLITQTILLREFLSVFNGNELVIGIILANWMLINGFGAFLGKYAEKISNKISLIIVIQLFLAILPILSVIFLTILRNRLFPPGSMVGIFHIFLVSFILLLPFCLLSGFLFTHFSKLFSEKYKSNKIDKVYGIEALGSIIGGVIFNFFLLFYFKIYPSLLFILIINLIAAFILSFELKKKIFRIVIPVLSVVLIYISLNIDINKIISKYLFINQELLVFEETPYGKLAITKDAGQVNYFENNVLLFTTNNIIDNEECIHYGMLQADNPKNILLISGGISGTIDEILKYDIEKIDYVEINPWIISMGKKSGLLKDNAKVNIINKDARLFIKETNTQYDVIIINVPEPSSAQINRYYTLEFYKDIKSILVKNGIISTSLMSTANYISNEAKMINSVLYATLNECFSDIIILPGDRNYFIASDSELSYQITKLTEDKNIINEYVNKYYLDDIILKERGKYISDNLTSDVNINKDFLPVSYLYQLLYWLSYFKVNYWILPIFIVLLILFIIPQLNPVSFGMFTGGFTAVSLEIVILLAFQIIYGYVYHLIGIIITIFMAGLAFGALFRKKIIKIPNINNYFILQLVIGLYALLLPGILYIFKAYSINTIVIHITFLLLTFIIAMFIGFEFSIASRLLKKNISKIAAELYSIDLIGSAIGALLLSSVLIPLIGIIKVCFVIAFLNLISSIVVYKNRRKYL